MTRIEELSGDVSISPIVDNPHARDFVAGICAGAATTLVVHPLDLIKVRLQVNSDPHSRLGTLSNVLKEILGSQQSAGGKGNGIGTVVVNGNSSGSRNGSIPGFAKKLPSTGPNISALYRGLWPNLLGNTSSWGLYFTLYHYLYSTVYRSYSSSSFSSSSPSSSSPSLAGYWICAYTAGAITALITNPIWVLKTRILSTSKHDSNAYKSMLDGAYTIARTEGLSAFWKGLGPGLIGILQGSLQFTIYEKFKTIRLREKQLLDSQIHSRLSTAEYISLSACSKIVATISMYPYQVIRARIQILQQSHIRSMDLVRNIYLREGLLGFYKGLVPNLLRVVPSTCITFVVYENVKHFLG